MVSVKSFHVTALLIDSINAVSFSVYVVLFGFKLKANHFCLRRKCGRDGMYHLSI